MKKSEREVVAQLIADAEYRDIASGYYTKKLYELDPLLEERVDEWRQYMQNVEENGTSG